MPLKVLQQAQYNPLKPTFIAAIVYLKLVDEFSSKFKNPAIGSEVFILVDIPA